MATETSLSSQLRATLKELLPPDGVIFKHSDYATAGIPDFSVTGYGRTVWVEVKLVDMDEKFRQRGLQHDTAQRLFIAGRCYYVVYSNVRSYGKRAYWLTPFQFDPKDPSTHPWLVADPGSSISGFNHRALATRIIGALRA